MNLQKQQIKQLMTRCPYCKSDNTWVENGSRYCTCHAIWKNMSREEAGEYLERIEVLKQKMNK